jgi:hypothetical protein
MVCVCVCVCDSGYTLLQDLVNAEINLWVT